MTTITTSKTVAELIKRATSPPSPPTTTRVILSAKGAGFRVLLEDGDVLLARTADPEHDACRALLSQGITGKLITRWAGSNHDSMILDIEKGARWKAKGCRARPLSGQEIELLPEDVRLAVQLVGQKT